MQEMQENQEIVRQEAEHAITLVDMDGKPYLEDGKPIVINLESQLYHACVEDGRKLLGEETANEDLALEAFFTRLLTDMVNEFNAGKSQDDSIGIQAGCEN